MAKVGLRLLGGFTLQLHTRPRALPARKAQALLAYLAVRAGRTHAREALTGLLWSDVGERQARQSLRQALVRVRRTLAGSRGALVIQGNTVALDPAALELDVAAFERLVRRGTPDALESAVALYRGPFLDGVVLTAPAFEEWLQSERTRLAELAAEALRRLLDRHVKGGRVEAATQVAVRLLALEPLQEEVHRTLMRLHVRQGRRTAALRQYQACLAVLQKELGVEPDAATKRLYLEILQQTTAAAPATQRAAALRLPLAAPDTPMVGRASELARARARIRTAWRDAGQVLLVTGEAGIGKSRLVEELVATAAARGARTLLGHAWQTEQGLPFGPWVDALRAGQALVGMREATAAALPVRIELARLFPELSPGRVPPAITPEGHLRLFESLDAVLGELARRQPVLMILEDLHWADEMSARLFGFVARRLGQRPIMLVGTSRDEDLADAPALATLLAELRALPHVEHIALDPLSAAETAALVRTLARAGSSASRLAETADRVWALSEGNPFVVVETMRALREGLQDADGIDLPQRVRGMIAARLARLGPRAREVVSLASAFTRAFEFRVLQRACRLSRRETAEAVEELVRRRLLHAVGERFDFTHARLRQAVYQSLLTPRRQTLHAAIGEAVEQVYAGHLGETYDRLAYHFGRADEPERALTYLVHLADKVARSHALDEAVRVLNEALSLTARLSPDVAGHRRLDVVYRLAHVLALRGRAAEARDLLLAHEKLAAEIGDPALSGLLHFWLAHVYGNLGDGASAVRHARRSREDAARAGDLVIMGKASYALSREHYIRGEPREGLAEGRQAVAHLEGSDEHGWHGQALATLAIHLIHVGDFGPALGTLERLRVLGESTGDVRLQAEAAWGVGRVHTITGEAAMAIPACRRAFDLAWDPVAQARALGMLGAAHLEDHDPGRAIACLEDAIGRLQALAGAGGYRSGQLDGLLRAMLAEAYLAASDLDRAGAVGAQALASTRAGGWPVAIGYAERVVGRLALATGRLDDAERELEAAVRTFAASETRAQVGRSLLPLAELRAARGDDAGAATALRTTLDLFTRMRTPRLVERTEALAAKLGVRLARD
jgi:DNA-binding SARP family transcriptional activator